MKPPLLVTAWPCYFDDVDTLRLNWIRLTWYEVPS